MINDKVSEEVRKLVYSDYDNKPEQLKAEIENIQSQQNGKGDDALRQQTTSELSEGTKASIPSYKSATCKPETQSADISNLLQKQRQEILEKVREELKSEFSLYLENLQDEEHELEHWHKIDKIIDKQLNQPKEEDK